MTSPMFKSRFNTASIEPLVTMKIAPKQEIKIPSHPILLNLSPMIKKANTEVIEGPTLSIKEAFEAVVICKALKSMQLCKKIPKKAIASNTIKSCLLGIKAFLPSVKARTIKIIEDAIENEREFTILCFDDLTSQYNYGLGVFASDEWKGFVLFHEGYGELPFEYKEEMEDYIKWDCVWSTAECEGWREVEYKNKTYLVKEW